MFSDTEVNLDTSLDSSNKKNLPAVPPVSVTNSSCLDIGCTIQSSIISEKPNSSSENSITSTAAVQRPPISLIPIAPVATPAITFRPIDIPDLPDIHPPFLLPLPPTIKTVARKLKIFPTLTVN